MSVLSKSEQLELEDIREILGNLLFSEGSMVFDAKNEGNDPLFWTASRFYTLLQRYGFSKK